LQITDDTAWKKKKLLHKTSCEKAKRTMNGVLFDKLQLSLDSFAETRDPQAYLCNFCELLAANIEKTCAKLKAVEDELVEKASNLTKLDETTSNRMTANKSDGRRKRPQLESAQAGEAELPDPGSNGEENLNIANVTTNALITNSRIRCSVKPPKNPSKDDSPNVPVSISLCNFANCL